MTTPYYTYADVYRPADIKSRRWELNLNRLAAAGLMIGACSIFGAEASTVDKFIHDNQISSPGNVEQPWDSPMFRAVANDDVDLSNMQTFSDKVTDGPSSVNWTAVGAYAGVASVVVAGAAGGGALFLALRREARNG